MAEIISVDGPKVKIGLDSGKIATVPIAAITYANPSAGDEVKVYKEGDDIIVNKARLDKDVRQVNKVGYILLTLFLGTLGVHRFMRGQIGIGLLYLFTLGALGFATLIDLIIALTKLGKYRDDFLFTQRGSWL
jgi:TM2 domain-containing membrane protein YozV